MDWNQLAIIFIHTYHDHRYPFDSLTKVNLIQHFIHTHTHTHTHTMIMAAQNYHSKHSTIKEINAGKDSYLDLVVITLLLAAFLPFLVMTPTVNMTSTVPTENKIVNGIGLLIVVLLLVWSLIFRILWAIPRCKQRCYISQDEDSHGTS